MARSTAKKRQVKPPCQHMTGYWINKDVGSFRCTDRCGFQFNIIDVKQDDRRKLSTITAGRVR